MSKPRVIALYLPQFHPIPENDAWWGKGFTEWYSVGKAKKLFWRHNQPAVPTELGYYDLRVPETRSAQAEMAKQSGVEGFCYWHYWFGNGKELLERPINEVVSSGAPDFPFCLAWANASWEEKIWATDDAKRKILIEQTYGGIEDYTAYFTRILPILKDKRYLTVENKLFFMVQNPSDIPSPKEFIDCWRQLAKDHNLPGFHFVAQANPKENEKSYFEYGFDAVYTNRLLDALNKKKVSFSRRMIYRFCSFANWPRLVSFDDVDRLSCIEADKQNNMYPGVVCGWDHTPRSGRSGTVFYDFSIERFRKHLDHVFGFVAHKPRENNIVILKSWNEWGEGNFMEPDHLWKNTKINELKNAIASVDSSMH